MKTIKVRGPWEPVTVLARPMTRILRLPWDGRETTPRHEKGWPALNLYESAGDYLLTVELPGIKPESVELDVTDDAISLSCRRQTLGGSSEEDYRRQERWTGLWTRQVVLPRVIDPDSVTAEMDKGVLQIRLKKSDHPQARRVPVTSTRKPS